MQQRSPTHELDSAYLAAIVDSSDDAIIGKDLNGIVTAWNPAAERMYGYSAAEMIGHPITVLIPPDRLAEEDRFLERIRRGERMVRVETMRRRRDGSDIAVSLTISPIRDRDGDIIGASKIARDITDRRQAAEQLRLSETKFRALFADNPLPIWAFDRKTLRFVEVNEAAMAAYGYSREEFAAMRVTDIRPLEDVQSFLATLDVPKAARRNAGEWRHRLRDGRIIDVSVTALDIELDGREVTLAVPVDITERKKAQASLRESEQMARGIIDNALDAFVQMDEAGRVTEWNAQAEAVFGWRRSEAVGRLVADLIVPSEHRGGHTDGLARFLAGGTGRLLGRRLEMDALRRDGKGTKPIRVELAVKALRRRSGHLFNAFIRDVTERTAAEERLRQAQRLEAVGQLTGGVAHDFNNILTVITGTIDILADAVAKEPQLAAVARMIDDAAHRGAELTQRLLAFARRQPLQPRETDINVLIVETAKLLRASLGEQVEIESMLDADAWPALIDPSQLSTALLNLAVNARDAMPGGGKLTLETGNVVLDEAYASHNPDVRPGPYVLIAVSDTGSGIPTAIRDKVFEPFFTTKEVGKGTGLGLSMVYGFVKQSNGHIKIYSEEGHGTSIKLYLPRVSGGIERPVDAVAAPPLVLGSESVLVVEDDHLVRDYVLQQLRSLGYAATAATNGPQALALIDAGAEFDLLFTDVVMPGNVNGRDLAEQAVRRRPSLKVLYTSGYTESAIVHHGRLDPDVLLLAKPYRKADLARMVRLAIETP